MMVSIQRIVLFPSISLSFVIEYDQALWLTVHEYSLGNIIRIMSGNNMIHVQHDSASVQCLATEYSTECA